MTDDLIDRIHAAMANAEPKLRALMAEVEARLCDNKLRDALDRLPGAYPESEPSPKAAKPQDLRGSDLCLAKAKDERNTRDTAHLKDYVPSDPMHAYPAEDFIGSGDRDPLGHDEWIRR